MSRIDDQATEQVMSMINIRCERFGMEMKFFSDLQESYPEPVKEQLQSEIESKQFQIDFLRLIQQEWESEQLAATMGDTENPREDPMVRIAKLMQESADRIMNLPDPDMGGAQRDKQLRAISDAVNFLTDVLTYWKIASEQLNALAPIMNMIRRDYGL